MKNIPYKEPLRIRYSGSDISEYPSSTKKVDRLLWMSSSIENVYDFILKHASVLIMIVVGATFLAMLALRGYLVFAYIPEIGGIESNVIYSLQRILDGYPLYIDPAVAPYSITQYTPLYYYLCEATGKFFQVDPTNVHAVYILSRSVSLVLNLLFAGATFVILRNIFLVSRPISFIALVYAFVYLDEESFSRPDSLYNLMVLATIGLFMKLLTEKGQQRPGLYLITASGLSIAAIFAKQSAIYVPVVLLFFLIFYLKNIRWTLVSLLAMGMSFGILFVISGGGDFYALLQNTVQGVNNGASLSWFAERIMIEHFQKERFINILGLFFGVYYLAKGKNDVLKFLGLSILGSFTFAVITGTKIGAAPNYFTEFITLTVMATVVFITSYDRSLSKQQRLMGNRINNYKPLFYLLFVLFTLPPRFAGKYVKKAIEINKLGEQGYLDNRAIADYLYQEEQLQPNDQVFITTHVHDYLNKFLYKNAIFPQKEIVVANPPDTYDYSAFAQGVKSGKVDYVIASISEGHVDTVAQKLQIDFDFIGTDFSPYVPIKQLGDYIIFKHQKSLHAKKEPGSKLVLAF